MFGLKINVSRSFEIFIVGKVAGGGVLNCVVGRQVYRQRELQVLVEEIGML